MLPGNLQEALSTPIDPHIGGAGGYRLASVLVVIYGSEPTVIMTVKPGGMRLHAGEISFPGGKMEDGDLDLLETALRETSEEIGLAVRRGHVTGQLKPVATLNSGFMILPLVCVMDSIPELTPNSEVEEILRIPLRSLLGTLAPDRDPSHNAVRGMYTFEHGGRTVWGASARILKEIHGRLGQ